MSQNMRSMKTSLETTDDGNEDNKQRQIYAKNSMDRFGDDLCELLLSYLSFEDRFRCECVSKQFQRTIFEKKVFDNTSGQLMAKNLLTFEFTFKGNDINSQLLCRFVADNQSLRCLTTLDSLQSFRRLKRLDLTLGSNECCVLGRKRQFFDISIPGLRITHFLLNLSQMDCNLLNNCHEFWPRLQYLSIRCLHFVTECLHHISRLPALQMLVIHCNQDIDLSDNDLNAVLSSSPKLKTIEIRVNNEKKFYSK
ncbi:unnamed protein product [Medioppia subpectinata]|uniref:F-box domain-containing protein n=1 Tax=Medioppia subpectinata TaxID=1979941 RepID=A0A7R9KGK3_9ACAR|nr:unnamed protein product [Medioppia subpectinata]CAG2103002.1 unnamed protein product [Medioppia subpectinata]